MFVKKNKMNENLYSGLTNALAAGVNNFYKAKLKFPNIELLPCG